MNYGFKIPVTAGRGPQGLRPLSFFEAATRMTTTITAAPAAATTATSCRYRHHAGFDRQQQQRRCGRRLGHQCQHLVSQLVAATEGAAAGADHQSDQAVTAQISALGYPQECAVDLPVIAVVPEHAQRFNSETATSSDDTAVTATAGSDARQRQLRGDGNEPRLGAAVAVGPLRGGSSAAVGTGTLTLSLGGTSFNVTIDSSDDTLAGIAAAINSASGNPGIRPP